MPFYGRPTVTLKTVERSNVTWPWQDSAGAGLCGLSVCTLCAFGSRARIRRVAPARIPSGLYGGPVPPEVCTCSRHRSPVGASYTNFQAWGF